MYIHSKKLNRSNILILVNKNNCNKEGIITNLKNLFSKKHAEQKPDYYLDTLLTNQLNGYYKDVVFEDKCAVKGPAFVKIGTNSRIGYHSTIMTIIEHCGEKFTPSMIIGKGTMIGSFNSIAVCNKIIIGNNVLFVPRVHINDHSHCFETKKWEVVSELIAYEGH